MKQLFEVVILVFVLTGCGVYTFNQSTLPSYFKSIDIPLFINQSSEPDVAASITKKLTASVLSTSNQLKLIQSNADASIYGTVLSYDNNEYQYDVTKARTADVDEYLVRIVVKVQFLDNHKNESLFDGMVTGEGTYGKAETEEIGRRKAVDDVVEQVLQNSIQSW